LHQKQGEIMTDESYTLTAANGFPSSSDDVERRLRDALVEAAMEWGRGDLGIDAFTERQAKIGKHIDALRDHLAKASAPEPERFKAGDQVWAKGTVEGGGNRIVYVRFREGQRGTAFRVEDISDTRQQPTDEALNMWIDNYLRHTEIAAPYRFMIRAALSHFAAPPITPAQWERIRHLALTEAPQVFVEEARAVIAGKL
jgi:hypothetical protein